MCGSPIGCSLQPSRSRISAQRKKSGGPDALHVWGGYVVGAIVIIRVVWGFVGPRHARFSDFVCGPLKALAYLKGLLLGRSRRYLGHSPAGGVMVIALLARLAATTMTGLVAYGQQGKGPMAVALVTEAKPNGNEAEIRVGQATTDEQEHVVGELHGLFANITLALVVMHILGVGLASLQHRENLVASMISGRKRGERTADLRH